ncbi:MAG: hypothetical protein AAF802_04765 [Planctomycetota bacterium]
MNPLRINLRDLFWLTLVASLTILACRQDSKYRNTKKDLDTVQSQLEQQVRRNKKFSALVGETLEKAGKMYAEGRESMRRELLKEANTTPDKDLRTSRN